MFEKKYKNAMDRVIPNQEALDNAINNAISKPKSIKNPVKIVLIACLSVSLICTSVFAAFKLSENENPPANLTIPNATQNNNLDDSIDDTKDIASSLSEQGFKYAENYEEIYESLKNANNFFYDGTIGDAEVEEPMEDEYTAPGSTDESPAAPEFSNTNNQVLGVQEGDVVKTDGLYIYHLSKSQDKVCIISAKDGITNIVSEITLPSVNNSMFVFELLLIKNTLVIIGETNSYPNDTVCMYYDLTDRSKPVKADETTQSGDYKDCRVVDGLVYTISQKYSYVYSENDNEDYTYTDIIPEINGELIGCEDLLISDVLSNSFTVITAYDTANKEQKSSLALLGECGTIYCSTENIYLVSNSNIYANNEPYSENEISVYESSINSKILRVSLNQGDITANGAACINGSINNQFSLDEKNGLLRVAATLYPVTYTYNGDFSSAKHEDSYSKVYSLDAELKIIGESEPLGVTETIKSVRYLGDIAYVVTFRQTDPLYAIDLTNPESPKTLSELKIKGFSTYMQSYGPDYMLGIGYEATLEGATNGIKLTMFDISNPADIFDVSTESFLWYDGYGYIHTEALNNHKAVLIDHKKGIIGIPFATETPINTNDWYYEYKQAIEYKLFNFDGKELTVGKSIEIPLKDGAEYWYGNEMRSLYIGDYLYVVLDSGLVSINLSDYSIVDTENY